ncbi:phosphate/phosphite/phosphonate ABC transporter substrate-binding protein [Bradyrhizobium prioriisuperbiae]|uniref:phosphate/phosphite/phosphonate ABC transporter substrate-binding protein n=1 Tax=Bradyrhizobium prioriisuperbiae TaxID=2854389 RepID=UPI0028E8CAA1|nr:PhnD/SsuA/transferrin family substrate-binding protein [Bradyrhizobium prioritasuperba]
MRLVVNARMYSATPAVKAAWQALFGWVSANSGIELDYVDHAAPAPLETLWARDDLGAVLMCGFPFASAAERPWLLAAPVPSSARYAARPQYCTDFIVRADGPFVTLQNTFGGRIGWTVTHSQSGYNAVRHHFAELDSVPGYARWTGPLITPRRVIDAIIDGTIDVGPLDSWFHDLLKRHAPDVASRIRVVASTEMAPIPPLVASRSIDADIVSQLRQSLLTCHTAQAMIATLDTLLLSRFAAVDAGDYQVLTSWAHDADARGVFAPG